MRWLPLLCLVLFAGCDGEEEQADSPRPRAAADCRDAQPLPDLPRAEGGEPLPDGAHTACFTGEVFRLGDQLIPLDELAGHLRGFRSPLGAGRPVYLLAARTASARDVARIVDAIAAARGSVQLAFEGDAGMVRAVEVRSALDRPIAHAPDGPIEVVVGLGGEAARMLARDGTDRRFPTRETGAIRAVLHDRMQLEREPADVIVVPGPGLTHGQAMAVIATAAAEGSGTVWLAPPSGARRPAIEPPPRAVIEAGRALAPRLRSIELAPTELVTTGLAPVRAMRPAPAWASATHALAQRHLAEVAECFARSEGAHDDARRVTVGVMVTAEGAPLTASAGGQPIDPEDDEIDYDALDDATRDGCLAEIAMRWSYPPPDALVERYVLDFALAPSPP